MPGIRMTLSEKIYQVLAHAGVILVALVCVAPFLFVVSASLTPQAVLQQYGGYVMFPPKVTFYAYQLALQTGQLLDAFVISVARVLVGTSLHLALCSMAGYALSKSYLFGRKVWLIILLISFLFGPGLIPFFVLCRTLGLVNTFWIYVVPGAVSAWSIFIFRQFFMELPKELEEAAILDGADELQVLLRVVLPLSMPVYMALGLFAAVGHWNDYLTSVIYIRDVGLYPVAMVLQSILTFATGTSGLGQQMLKDTELLKQIPGQSLKMATVVLSTIPILFVYPFLQKYFAKGMLTGAIKG
ncbi:MAG: carbohydrate ABC transporter permease [Chloroflexi bacterium HGW-Chloroflexi-1]|nr:MAG: carbohydrate ABC transporter permease [Chloroflexi bacterium HGW-Chloroflexi-1]